MESQYQMFFLDEERMQIFTEANIHVYLKSLKYQIQYNIII